MSGTAEFIESEPTGENCMRGVVLFGRNVASYKFALAKTILEFASTGSEVITLDELAVPFSRHICEHLAHSPRQSTSRSSTFLSTCKRYLENEITESELHAATAKLGFVNVIDAFHVVGRSEIPLRFFVDERETSTKGIRLTDSLLSLSPESAAQAAVEAEARWRLVETAWELGLNSSLVEYEPATELLLPSTRRRPITSARDSLNGYQKGRCFYCYRPIGTTAEAADLGDVDHLFPHVLQRRHLVSNLDQVWNLVLSCFECNRGKGGKFDSIPDKSYVARLQRRNEYLISSHHPLRETLIHQCGSNAQSRYLFLKSMFDLATSAHPGRWSTTPLADPTF